MQAANTYVFSPLTNRRDEAAQLNKESCPKNKSFFSLSLQQPNSSFDSSKLGSTIENEGSAAAAADRSIDESNRWRLQGFLK